MTQFRLHPVERAFELAKGGAFRSRSEISRAMEKEGYTMADVNQLEGTALTKQLNGLCREAQNRTTKRTGAVLAGVMVAGLAACGENSPSTPAEQSPAVSEPVEGVPARTAPEAQGQAQGQDRSTAP